MAAGQLSKVVDHLRGVFANQDATGLGDGQLLNHYVRQKDEAAFATLVRRHGPMVMGVCRRVLGNAHDAEDAFQATFLILVRKASALRSPGMLGNWLYGVAYRTALAARKMAAKRKAKEASAMPHSESPDDRWAELRPILDQELERLPEKYRAVIVLCDLEGKTRKEAARHLDWPEGTVASRLASARSLLAKRFSRYALGISGGALAALLSEQAASAAVQPAVISATIHAANLLAAGHAASAGSISANVAALTDGVLKTMLLTKLKVTGACLLMASIVLAGAGSSAYYTYAAKAPTAEVASTPRREAKPVGEQKPGETPKLPSDKPPANEPAPANNADEELSIKGSGKVVTKEMPFADFATLEVATRAGQVEIVQADTFRVAVTADDNLLPYVQVRKDGSTLKVDLDPRLKSFWANALKTTISMPALDHLLVGKHSRATCKGFKSTKTFHARLIEGSILNGEIEAQKVTLEATERSTVTLNGSAKEAKISASQGCRLSLTNIVIDQADITLKDESTALVNVTGRLEYDLSGSSGMEYRGGAAMKGSASVGCLLQPSAADPGTAKARENLANPPKTNGSHHQHGAGPGGHGAKGPGSGSPISMKVGDKVPDFTLRDQTGRALKFSELLKDVQRTPKGIIVLSFWCSTCSSCRRVEHHLDKLAKDYQGQALVLALDANAGETPENVSAFAAKQGLTLPIFLNLDARAADILGTTVTTTTAVIDGSGVLRYFGRFSDGQHAYAEDALKAVLAGKEVAVKTTEHSG